MNRNWVVTFNRNQVVTLNRNWVVNLTGICTQNPDYAKRMVKVRSKTVEPVLGTLINFLNMKRVNTRGIKQANKHVLMAAMTYNLKKYLKFIAKKPKSQAQVVSINQGKVNTSLKVTFLKLKQTFLRLLFLNNNLFNPKLNLD